MSPRARVAPSRARRQLDRLPAAYAHGAPGSGGLAELVLRARAAAALLGVHRSDTAGARAEGELRAWNLLVEGFLHPG